jgi:hypothetical protein
MEPARKLHYIILVFILLVAVAGAMLAGKQTPTGMTTMGQAYDTPYFLERPAYENRPTLERHAASGMPLHPERPMAQSYKIDPIDYFRDFFGTRMVFFPENDPCAVVIQKYVSRLDLVDTDRIETFYAGGVTHRFLTMLFEEQDKSMGKLTLVRGFDDPDYCRLRYEMSKIVVGISSWQKTMTLLVEAEGRHEGNSIRITKGSVSVPGYDFECHLGQ